MKRLLLGISLITMLLAQYSVGAGQATAATAPNWNVQTIDDSLSADLGQRPSIAISPLNNRPYVSYYDATQGALRLASRGPGQNPCDAAGWSCKLIDVTGTSGEFSSVAFEKNASGKYGVAYADPYNARLNLVRYAANDQEVSNENHRDYKGQGDGGTDKIKWTSLTFSGNDPVMSWYNYKVDFDGDTINGAEYQYANAYGDGQTFDTQPEDTARDDTTELGLGAYVSSDVDHIGRTVIAYRGLSNKNLRFSYTDYGKGFGCNKEWAVSNNLAFRSRCITVDPAPNTGYYISYRASVMINNVVIPQQVAYLDASKGQLKYAKYVGGNSTCGAGGGSGWKCVVIDTVGKHTAMGVSMTLDAAGNPVIAYYDRGDNGTGVLKVARPATGAVVGNCGPSSDLFPAWSCNIIDDGAGKDVGQGASVAVDKLGQVYVAYYNATDKSLMVAHEKNTNAPTFTKSYGVAALQPQATTSVKYTIKTHSENPALTGLKFADGLVGNMTFQPGSVANNCGGTVSLGNSNHAIKLENGYLAKDSACVVSATIIADQLGTYDDLTTALASNEAANAPIAGAKIKVFSMTTPTFTKSYTPAAVSLGATSVVKYTIKNNLPDSGLSTIAFNDVFPATLSVKPNTITNTCGGTVSMTPNAQTLALVNGMLAKGATCTIKATVATTIGGVYTQSTSKLTTDQTADANAAQATLTVNNPVPVLTKLSQTTAKKGSPTFTLTVTGSKFAPNSVVRWHGGNRVTTFVNSTTLKAEITAQDLQLAGPHNVRVFTPTPGGGKSAIIVFTVQP